MPMAHLSTGRSGLRIGKGGGGSGPSRLPTHPQPTHPRKDCSCKHSLRIWVELPELRGQAAAQVVDGKVSARGAPEREVVGERRRTQMVASATRVLPLRATTPSVPTPTPYPAMAWRRGCRGAAAHSVFSAVSSPSCEGTLPLRSLSKSHLREGRRSGVTVTDAECGKCDARASPTAPPYPPPPRYSATAWRRGCRAAVAHSCFSAVRSPSCEGKLPPRSFPLRDLREGRRSGRSWGNGDGHRGWQVRRACFPYAPPYPPPPRYSATAWRRGCRAAVAHRVSSLVSSPNCVGKLPPRLLS
eukprot:scaffold33166_cov56-Phaeocystis_antarctica.AAC.1